MLSFTKFGLSSWNLFRLECCIFFSLLAISLFTPIPARERINVSNVYNATESNDINAPIVSKSVEIKLKNDSCIQD